MRRVVLFVEQKQLPDNAYFLFLHRHSSGECSLHWESCTCFAKLSSRSYHRKVFHSGTHVQAAKMKLKMQFVRRRGERIDFPDRRNDNSGTVCDHTRPYVIKNSGNM